MKMKKIALVTLASASVLGAVQLFESEVASAESIVTQAEVRFRVVDDNGRPVPNSVVEISTNNFTSRQQVKTDENGYAYFNTSVGNKVQAIVSSVPQGYRALAADLRTVLVQDVGENRVEFKVKKQFMVPSTAPVQAALEKAAVTDVDTYLENNPVSEVPTIAPAEEALPSLPATDVPLSVTGDSTSADTLPEATPSEVDAYLEANPVSEMSGDIAESQTVVLVRVEDENQKPVVGATIDFVTDTYGAVSRETDNNGNATLNIPFSEESVKVRAFLTKVPNDYILRAEFKVFNAVHDGENTATFVVNKNFSVPTEAPHSDELPEATEAELDDYLDENPVFEVPDTASVQEDLPEATEADLDDYLDENPEFKLPKDAPSQEALPLFEGELPEEYKSGMRKPLENLPSNKNLFSNQKDSLSDDKQQASLPKTSSKTNSGFVFAGILVLMMAVLGFGYVGRHDRKK